MLFQPKFKATLFLSAIMFFAGSILLNAQSDLKKKINDIKGKAQKVTVKTDDGEVTFEGNEAEEILNKIKKQSGTPEFWVRKLNNDSTHHFPFSGLSDKNKFLVFNSNLIPYAGSKRSIASHKPKTPL